jgi:RND family efflux transporter MFP subunit
MEEKTQKRGVATFLLYLAGLILVLAAGFLVRRLRGGEEQRLTKEVQSRNEEIQKGPRVQVVHVQPPAAYRTVTLLGETYSFYEATLYAKVSGYLKDVRVDKGDRVKSGEIVAEIESPETDSQYRGAVADAHNKLINAQRATRLVARDMIAQQDADQAVTDSKVSAANVSDLATLKAYEIIRAPFDGLVTARYADPGALVQNATGSQTSALPVVKVSKTDVLRVYVYPNQADASEIRVGDAVEITDPTRDTVKIRARVTRLSGELDPRTRTMLSEIDFNNRNGLVIPGSFVQVAIRVRQQLHGLQIPSEALLVRGGRTLVAIVGPDDKVRLRPVVVARDDGATVSVRSGLAAGEQVVLNLGSKVDDGGKVQPVKFIAP